MVDFRRCITALAVLALFVGLASAQIGGGGGGGQTQEQCGTNVSVTPTLRAEGYTEETGDITISCTGGTPPALGSTIPTVNITVFLNTAVTSRLLPQTSVSNNISEALLLIDEPGSGLTGPVPGFGPNAPQVLCGTPLVGAGAGGCTQFVEPAPGVAGQTVASGTASSTNPTVGANVFQGIVSGNSVTFFGIPVLPPTTAGVQRVYRLTNIRANATTLGGGSAAGAAPVIASISISGSTSLLIGNPTPTVGFVQAGLTASASSATNLNQCNTQTKTSTNTLTFNENFGTAWKTRVAPLTNTLFAGQSSNATGQNVPGQIYNSESNFIFTSATGNNGGIAGLSDFGTRLKATFNNIPTGTRLFVSVNNIFNNGAPITAPAVIGGTAATTWAQLVASETAGEGNIISGFFPQVVGTDNAPGTSGNVPVAEIPVVNGTAQAVWEILNTNPATQETAKFGVYTTYTSNVAQNSPPPGVGTVNLSFAPTPPSFSASSGAAASSSLPIPRFISDPNAARNILNVNICRTILLFPFVTNQAGFDTGLAIANTSTDPFGTAPQAGSCDLNWYSGPNSPPKNNTGTIASGTVYATLASTTVSGFQGYMIAVCNFQYAHGFAFVSDLGAQKLAMGYLALVIVDPTTQANGVRNASPLGASNVTVNGGGEDTGH